MVTALVAAGLLAGPTVTAQLPLVPEIPKIHIEPLAPGLPALPNPPYVAPLDLNAPPRADQAHPRLLFSRDDLPAIRARIADPDSMPGRAWRALVERVDRRVPTDPLLDRDGRTFGRDDLADAAFVWLVTQDPQYLAKARGLLSEVVATAPDYGGRPVTDVASVCCEYYNTRAHLLNGFALAWDLLYDDLTDGERAALLGVVLTLGTEHYTHAYDSWWGTVSQASNFSGNNGAAVGMAGLALYGDVPSPVPDLWIAKGRQLVASYAESGFDATGSSLEGVLYGNYGLRIPTLFGAALERAGADNPVRHPNLRRQPRWVAYELLPGGGAVNPLNDARYHDLNPVHLTWATRYGADPDLAGWIWDHFIPINEGGPGVGEPLATILWYEPPDPAFAPEQLLPLGQAFTGRGLVHTRTGWGSGALMSSFEARQNVWGEGIHHNQDVNSFTLYADGARFVVDSGYANWLEKQAALNPEGARSSETEAHSYIVADGRSQDFFSTGRLTRAASTAAVGDPGTFDVAVGDARLAYLLLPPQRADRYFVHVRDPSGVGPGYVLLGDVFRQDHAVHHYTSYLHTEPGNTVAVLPQPSPNVARARFTAPNAAALDITMAGTSPLGSLTETFTADYPRIGAHPRLGIHTNTDALQTLTVLAPTIYGRPPPAVTAAHAPGGLGLTVDQAGRHDIVLLRTTPVGDVVNRLPVGTVHLGTTTSDGELVLVSTDPGTGTALRFVLVEGTVLDHGGRRLAEVDGGVATVVTSATRVVVTGDHVTGFRIEAAPTVHTVTLDGEPVEVSRCGTTVVYPARSC